MPGGYLARMFVPSLLLNPHACPVPLCDPTLYANVLIRKCQIRIKMPSAVGDFTRQNIFDDECNSSFSFPTGLFKRTFYSRNNYYNNKVS